MLLMSDEEIQELTKEINASINERNANNLKNSNGVNLMNGIIKMYNEQKGFGFIQTQTRDVFFHISSVINKDALPERGLRATFEVKQTSRGEEAFNVTLIIQNRPQFIKLGQDRIKLSDIKNYGIYAGNESKLVTRLEKKYISQDEIDVGYPPYTKPGWYEVEVGEFIYTGKKYHYLSIETYQGAEYKYSEKTANFNIYDKLKELDEYLA